MGAPDPPAVIVCFDIGLSSSDLKLAETSAITEDQVSHIVLLKLGGGLFPSSPHILNGLVLNLDSHVLIGVGRFLPNEDHGVKASKDPRGANARSADDSPFADRLSGTGG